EAAKDAAVTAKEIEDAEAAVEAASTKLEGYKGLIETMLADVDDPFALATGSAAFLPISTYYTAAFIMSQMGDDYTEKVVGAVDAAVESGAFEPVAGTPFGFVESLTATWGPGSGKISSGLTATMLIKTVGDLIKDAEPLKETVIRSVNYTMGTHPYNDTSWLTGVGASSHKYPYNSNRADEGFIPGSIVPGYINFRPDFPESLDNFSFLWAENECTVGVVSSWIAPAKMAAEIAAEKAAPGAAESLVDFSNSFLMKAEEGVSAPDYLGGPSYPAASLKTRGFDLFMYNTIFSQIFGDQHCAGIELIQNGQRIATNGDIHLLPTPEQWDATPAPILTSRGADLTGNTVTAKLTIPGSTTGGVELAEVKYTLKAEPEAGGVKLSVTLDAPLPADLAGKAGFNLEFIPNLYREKGFIVDKDNNGTYDEFGIFPLLPFDDMEIKDRARTIDQAWYVKEWNEDRGDYQPVPFAKGKKMVLAPEDDENRIRITSDSGDLELFDGRNRSQNGWFVLRTLIPENGTEVVWHISPDVDSTWVREPNVAHSQAGYAPLQSKVAVIELDPNYSAPATASLERLEENGSYTTALTSQLGSVKNWLRYNYRDFDFSAVTKAGIYAINYAGKRTDVFRIGEEVYDKSWQTALSGFLAKEMDHIAVREAYKIVHAASHMDDAIAWPLKGEAFRGGVYDGTWFDGQDFDATSRTNKDIESLKHIPGLNVGGWYDAGDYDIEATRNQGVILDLAAAYNAFKPDYDTLAITWDADTGGMVEMHRADKVPDIIQQVKHGAMQVYARLEAVGYNFKVVEVPTLRQYTHLGDGARDTDGFIYDPTLGENERKGLSSGKQDDRLAMIGEKSSSLQYGAAAALASASYVLKGEAAYSAEADKYLAAATKIWDEEDHPDVAVVTSEPFGAFSLSDEWNAAIQLLIATNGDNKYKARVSELAPAVMSMVDLFPPYGFKPFSFVGGWKAVFALPYMDDAFKASFKAAVNEYIDDLDKSVADNPFGVPSTNGMWGGSNDVVDMGMRMYYLHEAFPELVSTDYILRSTNYILGTHPYNDVSWLSGVGTSSIEHAYGNTRADDTYVAGGIVPGYVNISPDFPEAQDEFGMMWFESEYVIDTSAKWVALGNAAADLAKEAAEYTVRYNANGGSGLVSSDTSYNVGGDVTVKASTGIARSGYRFTEWNTAADGTGTAYKAGDTFKIGSENILLYAQWSRITGNFPVGESGGTVSAPPAAPATSEPAVTTPEGPEGSIPSTGGTSGFSDASSISSWAAPFVERLVTAGIISGRTDGSFDPKGNVSRAEFTKMIIIALGIDQGESPKAFTDVAATDWFKEFVDSASSNNIIQGIAEGVFAPNNTISRQDLCVIAYNAMTSLGISAAAGTGGFTDDAAISDYAKQAVNSLKQIGIIGGRDDGSFDPMAYASREEAAKIICGVLDYVTSQQSPAQPTAAEAGTNGTGAAEAASGAAIEAPASTSGGAVETPASTTAPR
ncbi:MAG: S-layer homology domain-containing protein, partial [Clostridiales Family XIII bacterium]|nr:S-layer homology domain-containing protein [Clostridiales Family XIII bacterium]